MNIRYKQIREFEKGTLFRLLEAAYAYDDRFEKYFNDSWRACDDFFYEHLNIADKCCFIMTVDDLPIGFVCWDPRNIPEYVEVGHNCIVPEFKGKKLGKIQLLEALERIKKNHVKRITVTTNVALIPAQKNYESLGFEFVRKRINDTETKFSGDYIDYEMIL